MKADGYAGCRIIRNVFSVIIVLAASAALSTDYYVAGSLGTASPDAAWTAMGSIADAVAAAFDGEKVWLGEGDHSITNAEISIVKAVTVRGVTGNRDDVIVKPAKSGYRLFRLNHANAKLLDLTLHGATITAQKTGGANLFIDANGGTVSNCVIRNGNATSWGSHAAGVYMTGAGLVSHCVITNNSSSSANGAAGGAAVYMSKGLVENCLIAKNNSNGDTTSGSGAIQITGGRLVNSTVAKNQTRYYSGVFATGGYVTNCLIAKNTSTVSTSSTYPVYNSASRFVKCAAEVLINDTCVSDFIYFKSANDYRAVPGAVFVDMGANLGYTTSDTDLDGNPRVNASGLVDIGCYEYAPASIEIGLSASAISGLEPLSVTFTGHVAGGTLVAPEYQWDFDGDGIAEKNTSVPTVEHVYGKGGNFTAKLTVVDGANTYAALNTVALSIAARNIYVVPNNANAAVPYDTYANAAATVEDALAVAGDDSTIWLTNGVHTLSGGKEIYLTSAITIRGATGNRDDVTVKKPASGSYRVIRLNNANAAVADLTISDGKLTDQRINTANVMIDANGGTVTNCVIRNGAAAGWGDYCGGVSLLSSQARVTRCVITNNTAHAAARDGGGGSAVYMTAGLVDNCLIAQNKCTDDTSDSTGAVRMKGGRLVNCTVVGNSAKQYSGVYASGGAVTNCLIKNNQPSGNADETASVYYGPSRFVSCAAPILINDVCVTGPINFKDEASGDYHPVVGSVMIDAGADLGYTSADTDVDGASRVSGSGVDIGCHEYFSSGLDVGLSTTSATEGIVPLYITLTAEVSGGAEGETYSYFWDFFGNGNYVEGGATVTHVYDTPTNTVARVRVMSGGSAYDGANTVSVTAHPAVLYVMPENECASWPYNSRTIAATNILDAIAEAYDGSLILVAPGTYSLGSVMDIQYGMTIRGEGDNPDAVSFRPKSSGRVCLLNHPDAKIENVVLERGSPIGSRYSGGNLYVDTRGGTVSNCIIRNAIFTGAWGSKGAGLCMVGNGTVTHCVITNNALTAVGDNSGDCTGIAALMWSGRLSNCLIAYNKLAYSSSTNSIVGGGAVYVGGGRVENCTVVGNTFWTCAGVYVAGSGTVTNTIIAGNVSLNDPLSSASVYGGSASGFGYCASDILAINDSCLTAATMGFRDAAHGDFRLAGARLRRRQRRLDGARLSRCRHPGPHACDGQGCGSWLL